jgi:hypothetical protein
MNTDWNYPTAVRVGAGRLREVSAACQEFGITTPLLVTDPGLLALPMVEQTAEFCRTAGLGCGVFSEIKSNPTGANIKEGVRFYHDGNHDGVIALGGGSALDAGKAVALMVGQHTSLWDFEDISDNWTKADAEAIAPVVAIPTTAGTGSEVGRASVIVDEDAVRKKIIFHPRMLPSTVILDPELTIELPPFLTAATGMDALSHNLEAWCSPMYHPMAEGIAVEGIRRISKYLPRVVVDGTDIEARTQMLVASTMGATAFQRGLGAMHALAHPLGALYDAHHGTLNAVLMPYVLEANRPVIASTIRRLAQYIGLEFSTFDGFLDWVLKLRSQIGIPENLAALEISDEDAHRVGKMAFEDPSASTNPIPLTISDYEMIFRNAVRGDMNCTRR